MKLELDFSPQKLALSLGNPVIREGGGEPYSGGYEVTPSAETQTLETAGKKLSQDVTINPIPQGWYNTLKRGIIRPDAELVESWSYDKLWIAEEGETLPAYSTTATTLRASEQLTVTHEWDLENYKYLCLMRGLVIPLYNTDNVARGRVEWSMSNTAYELVCADAGAFRALVDPTASYRSPTLAWITAGGAVYRMPYFTNSLGQLSVYSATSYGLWVTMVAPSYASGALYINSPSLTFRCQANVFDKPFYEALTDIRFQWKIELWREPVGSLDYNGWTANQELDHILGCVYSPTHKLT